MGPAEARQLERWLAARLQAQIVTIEDLRQHAEGFSWETYTFTAYWRGDRGEGREGLALRREPSAGLLPPYDAASDHRLHAAVQAASTVPLPRLRWLEEDPAVLGRPFYVMDRVEGIVPVPWNADDPRAFPDDGTRRQIGEHFVDVMADIHAIDLESSGTVGVLPAAPADPVRAALAEVDRWAAVAHAAQLVGEPLLEAALVWLRRNVAVSGRRTLVHGDYRLGNVMVRDGRIVAVFDWELAHVGDPVFDLAWANLRLYRGRSHLMSRLLPLDQALDRYAGRTGVPVEPDVLHWWTVFSWLRAIAPHLRAAQAFRDGGTDDVRLAAMGHRHVHLLKFLAEELRLRRPTRAAPEEAPADISVEEQPMKHDTPERLLRGTAAALREAAGRIGDGDPYVRAQLLAAAEVIGDLAPRVDWRAAEMRALIERIREVLATALAHASAAPGILPLSAAALAEPPPADSEGLLAQRDRHVDALTEVQRWADAPAAVTAAVEDLLAWHLESEVAQLRAGAAV